MTTFGRLNEDGELEDVREIAQADLRRCPFAILVPEHYYADGTCKCGDPTERARMIREWGYSEEDFAGVPLVTPEQHAADIARYGHVAAWR